MIEKGDTVKLTLKGPPGEVKRFPRQHPGEPPLAEVLWKKNGKLALHDRRDLILVEKGRTEGNGKDQA